MTRYLAAILCVGFWAVTAKAQDTPTDSLTLLRFLDIVAKNHPTAIAAMLEENVATAEIDAAQGFFDPFISGDIERKEQANKEKFTNFQAGVEIPFNTLFGPKLEARYERGVGPFINPETSTEPSGQAVVGVSLPLWSGVLTDARRTSLEKSMLAPDRASAFIMTQINALLVRSGASYWKWAEDYYLLGVASNLLEIAEIRAEQVRRQVEAGAFPRIDLVEANQEVQRRRGDLLAARQRFEQSSNSLAAFLWEQGVVPRILREIPQELPELPVITPEEEEANRQAAFQLRPELAELAVARKAAELDLALAAEAEKPRLSSKMQLMYVPDKPNFTDYKVGLDMSFPLFFRTASANSELTRIRIERLNLREFELQRRIEVEVDNALIAYRRSIERLEVAQLETQLAVELEEGERTRFREGQSTLFVVNIRERATGEARARLVRAHATCLSELLQYYWAIGRIGEFVE